MDFKFFFMVLCIALICWFHFAVSNWECINLGGGKVICGNLALIVCLFWSIASIYLLLDGIRKLRQRKNTEENVHE